MLHSVGTVVSVAFSSDATNLVPGDTNSLRDVFARFIDEDGDGSLRPVDNCPTTPNAGQANVVHPATSIGDACEDPDLDGVYDATDNCPDTANAGQANFDGDSRGDVCDIDDDNDGVSDVAEPPCGGDPLDITPPLLRPERVDGILFAGVDDDGDTAIDEALPVGGAGFDCDGDGYTGTAEDHVYSYIPQLTGNQKTCQEYDAAFPNPTPRAKHALAGRL